MKNTVGLDVTASNSSEVEILDVLTELFFRKKSGIDKFLPEKADIYPDCPMLQIYAAQMFFYSFSLQTIKKHFPPYLARIDAIIASGVELNKREELHFRALKMLYNAELVAALGVYAEIAAKYPCDTFNIVMIETCGFLGGKIDTLLPIYNDLLATHHSDPDFLSMYAFLLCHLDRLVEARVHVEKALDLDPHNAWAQHVFVHTLDESKPAEIELGIRFLEPRAADWPKQNRFFEGHVWMHLLGLYFVKGDVNFDRILSEYTAHLWGEAREFSFEQNNAFWVLWQADLHGYGDRVPTELREDLAVHAGPFMYDYVTPYLSICAILSVAQYSIERALPGIIAFEAHAASKGGNWHEVALPVLHGCIEYLKGNLEVAQAMLAPVASDVMATRPICHSDEQRVIFPATLNRINELLAIVEAEKTCAFKAPGCK